MESARADEQKISIHTEEITAVTGRNIGVKGETGPAGAAGSDAPIWNPDDDWNAATAYGVYDVVCHTREEGGDGSGYICIAPNTNQPPTSSGTYWVRMVQAGQEGPQGPSGASGSSVLGNWAGVWGSGNSYVLNDIVRDNTDTGLPAIWLCLDPHTSASGNRPRNDSDKWQKLIWGLEGPQGAKGNKGDTGPIGPAGPTGSAGPRGAAGADGSDGADGADGQDALIYFPFSVNGNGAQCLTIDQAVTIRSINKRKDDGTAASWTVQIKKNGSVASLPISCAKNDVLKVTVTGADGEIGGLTLSEAE